MSDFYSIQQDAYPSISEVDEMCAQTKKCEHKHTEQAEYYYGTLETDFYYYWICSDCGEEVQSEPDEA
tara:strand:- start:273 stop:476 length:204 start_codon:yes stop_codon:yes gene_type:complete